MSHVAGAPLAPVLAGLRPASIASSVPAFEAGWVLEDGTRAPYLAYVDFTGESWSEGLEELHEESSGTHFIDGLTRDVLLRTVAGSVPAELVQRGLTQPFGVRELVVLRRPPPPP